MDRRKFLRIAGTSGVVLAAGAAGVSGFVATRTPHSALQPWETAAASPYADPIRRALSFAILAPNPHNRQPWIVKLIGETEALLYCDSDRLLPVTDPFDRQIVIGLGCFLELLALAAGNDGYRTAIDVFPEGVPASRLDERPIAKLILLPDDGLVPDPLFAEALHRRTNRNPYNPDRPISRTALQSISAAAGTAVNTGTAGDGDRLQALRQLTRNALRAELLDKDAFGESIDLMRIGRAAAEANPDGIYLGGAVLEALNRMGVVTREKMSDPESSAFQVGLDMADDQALTAAGFVWLATSGNTRQEQIAAGRSYLRVALQVSALGIAMQPMSQALQEYAAMQDYFKQVHELLADEEPQRIQMLARLGYADDVPPAPRWALATRILTA